MIKFNLKKKIIFAFIFIELVISGLLGFTMYSTLIKLFIKDFRNHKLSIARFISLSIDGSIHDKFIDNKTINLESYEKYSSLIHNIKKNEDTIKYIYTLIYNKNLENFYYGVDFQKNSYDFISLESELFGVKVFHDGKKTNLIYGYNIYNESILIPNSFYDSVEIKIKKGEEKDSIILNNKEILSIYHKDNIIYKLDSIEINQSSQYHQIKIMLNNLILPLNISYNEKNNLLTNTGKKFIERASTILKLKNIILSNSDFIDDEPVWNSHGLYMSAYSIIRDSTSNPIGLVIVDIEDSEIQEFKSKFTKFAILISTITFIITALLSLVLAGYFTKPLKILSEAVEKISDGNLEILIDLNSKDEFGSLAKNFNAMINNLNNSSKIQKQLIKEISSLNDSLEKKVEERTFTIQQQSKELKKQLEIAKKIQFSLLPQEIPKTANATISFKYKPMMDVGGDLIDFHFSNNNLYLFVCDVSGHGVPAAFLAIMVKMSLQDCFEKMLPPHEILNKIHQSLLGKLSNHFLSALIIKLDFQHKKIEFSNAGHLPFILLKKDGFGKFIHSKGRIINELFSPNCITETLDLVDGDRLILYTDGLTETRNQFNQLFGEDYLLSFSIENYKHSVQDLSDKIYNEALNFKGIKELSNQMEDDLTLLITEYKE